MSHRRTKVLALLAVAALALVVFTSVGVAQESPPVPDVDSVSLAAEQVAPGWEHTVAADSDLVGVEWSGDPTAEFSVEVQRGTTEWETVSDVGRVDNGPDPGTADAASAVTKAAKANASEPVWVGHDVSAVRIGLAGGPAEDVTLQSVHAPSGESPAHSALVAGRISGWILLAGAVIGLILISRRWLALLAVAAVALAGCVDAGPPAPSNMVLRSSWGSDFPWACEGLPEYTPTISKAIVHHTANSNTYKPEDSTKMIRAIWAYHVFTLGYCDIAYNFLIDQFGTIYEGRIGGITNAVVGAHSLGNNIGTTGIAMLGTYSTVLPPQVELNALIDNITWKFKVHKVDPKPETAIIGHRDVYATECPGQEAYKVLPFIRLDVRNRIGQSTIA